MSDKELEYSTRLEAQLAEVRAERDALAKAIKVQDGELLQRAEAAEAKLKAVVDVGHDDDCILCGFKDRIALGLASPEAARAAAKKKP